MTVTHCCIALPAGKVTVWVMKLLSKMGSPLVSATSTVVAVVASGLAMSTQTSTVPSFSAAVRVGEAKLTVGLAVAPVVPRTRTLSRPAQSAPPFWVTMTSSCTVVVPGGTLATSVT